MAKDQKKVDGQEQEKRIVTPETYTKLQAGDIIETQEGITTQVEFIKDGYVYMYHWNSSRHAPSRLAFEESKVKELLEAGKWKVQNVTMEVNRGEYVLWDDKEFVEVLEATKKSFEETGGFTYTEGRGNQLSRIFKVVIEGDEYFIQTSNETIKSAIENKNYRIISYQKVQSILNAVLNTDACSSEFYPVIKSKKKVFYNKRDFMEYFEGIPYEAITIVEATA